MLEGSWKMRSDMMDSGSWSGILLILSKWFIQEDPCTHGPTAVWFQFELQGQGVQSVLFGDWVLKYEHSRQTCRHGRCVPNNLSDGSRLHISGWDTLRRAGGVWSYHHMCDVVSHAADVQLSAPVPLSVPDCSVLARGLLVPCGSVKTGHIPICASGCI